MSPISEPALTLRPELWLAHYGDAMYGYALSRLRDADEAAELVQDTMVTALEKRSSFSGKSSEKTWLFAILKNKLVDLVRRQAKNLRFEEGAEDDSAFFSDTPLGSHWQAGKSPKEWAHADEPSPEDEALHAQLQACLGALPPMWARLFTLKSVDELPTETICKELSISPSNLWVILHRARLRLRACVETYWA